MRVPSASTGRPSRGGLTLLEVLLALTIFLFSLVAIGRLITMGTDRARDIQGRAAQLCQSKLAEVAIGDPDAQSGSGTFEEDPDWQWTVDQEQSGIPGLLQVTVTVKRSGSDDSQPAAVLTQMVLDPSQRGSSLDPDPTTLNTDNSSSDSSGGSSSGSGSGSGSSGAAAAPAAAMPVTGAAAAPAAGSGKTSGASSGGSKGGKP